MELFTGLKPLPRGRIRSEVIAGLSLAAIGIPISMGYCTIAHMPLATGLYTMILPALAYAIFGSSRHLSVSADSASAAILAAGLVGLAPLASQNYVALAGLVAGLTGLMLIIARLFHLGFLANFLSRTLLVGFLLGVGVTIAFGQIPKMLGLSITGHSLWAIVGGIIGDWNLISWPTAAVSGICLAVLLIGTRLKSVPTELVVIILGIAAASFIGLNAYGIQSVGTVHAGLPVLSMPHVPAGAWPHLVATAVSLVVVILAQSSSLARAYAARYDEPFDADHDLVGLGVANFAAMASGAFVVNSSVTKTELTNRLGSRTQWASLVAAAAVLVAVFTITGALSLLPVAVLASVVFWIALGMIHISTLRELFRQRRDEGVIALITAVGVIVLGIEYGILLSILLCLLNHVRHGYNPSNHLLTLDERGAWLLHDVAEQTQAAPGLIIYRFQAALYYANVERFLEDVRSLCTPVPPERICIDCAAIADVDFTSGEVLLRLTRYVNDLGIHMVFVHVSDEVREQLTESGVVASDMIEFGSHMHDLIDSHGGKSGGTGPTATAAVSSGLTLGDLDAEPVEIPYVVPASTSVRGKEETTPPLDTSPL